MKQHQSLKRILIMRYGVLFLKHSCFITVIKINSQAKKINSQANNSGT